MNDKLHNTLLKSKEKKRLEVNEKLNETEREKLHQILSNKTLILIYQHVKNLSSSTKWKRVNEF